MLIKKKILLLLLLLQQYKLLKLFVRLYIFFYSFVPLTNSYYAHVKIPYKNVTIHKETSNNETKSHKM